ncbi:unnamed protein product [Phytomonas sp. EM1]|nr:unnamed protein product [Phytomonas sp. EM1]|eukprot:CCW62220.1 unnamed protein product [Phytomonas sp. isolate EM1]
MLRFHYIQILRIEHSACAFPIRSFFGTVNNFDASKKFLNSGEKGVTGMTQAEHCRLYRSLLKLGEEGTMMRHCLSVHHPLKCVSYGKRLESLHQAHNVTVVNSCKISIIFHPMQRFQLFLKRHFYSWNICLLRLSLHIWNVVSDTLVYTLFIMIFILFCMIFRLCTVLLQADPTPSPISWSTNGLKADLKHW